MKAKINLYGIALQSNCHATSYSYLNEVGE